MMIETINDPEPSSSDVLITDVSAKDLHEIISGKLKEKYLSDSEIEYDGDIKGIIHGQDLRLFCATTVKINDKIKIVLDTGSPTTYLSEEVMNAFGLYIPNSDKYIYV